MNTDPIFRSTEKNKKQMDTRSMRRRVDYYLNRANLKRRGLSAHSLRRTSASLAIENGCSLLELQIHMDHASPMTSYRYIARLEKMKNRAASQIPIKF